MVYGNDPMEENIPLAFRMLGEAPGIFASMGFGINRAANTIMSGGGYSETRKISRLNKNYLNKEASNFIGSKASRLAKLNAGKTPMVKRALQNNIPRPGNLRRYSDLSIFAGESKGLYTPFAASGYIGRNKRVADALGIEFRQGESVLSGGLMGAITASNRMDRLERKAIRRASNDRRIGRRLSGRLSKADASIAKLHAMNAASPMYSEAAGQRMLANARGVKVGVRGNQLVSALGAEGTQKLGGFFRGAMGYNRAGGFTSLFAQEGSQAAVNRLGSVLGDIGLRRSGAKVAEEALEKGVIKTIGLKRTMQVAATKKGATVLGARALGLAIPGLNVLATASFMYDIGKMGGEAVKGAINLAKDSVKSLQGSIYKPMFGMGYKDTEAAATSRARGVMAIQNSRLNARSMLGSEAGMMAAHFG